MNSKIYCKPPFSCRKFAQAKKKKNCLVRTGIFFRVHTKKTNDERRRTKDCLAGSVGGGGEQ